MTSTTLLIVYCAAILAASLSGGLIPLLVRLTHTRLQIATSFVAGLMLGVGLLHLLPHSFHQLGDLDHVALWMLAGFVTMFFIQRFFQFHHHDVPDESPEARDDRGEHAHAGRRCDHAHHHPSLAEKSARNLSWAGAAIGLTLHTLLDGAALAASVRAESALAETAALAGLGVFLVIILHKPFDALTIGTLMAGSHLPRRRRHVINVLFALGIPAGVMLFEAGLMRASSEPAAWIGAALAFSGGSFVCIAASDLLPELQFHAHDRGLLSAALLAGIGLAILIGKLEHSGHAHHVSGHSHEPGRQVEPHPHP